MGRPLLAAVLGIAAVLGVSAAGEGVYQAQAHSAPPKPTAAPVPSPRPSPVHRRPKPSPAPRTRRLPVMPAGRVSVAVLDLRTGVSAGYGGGEFDTASIVKVDILAALLLRTQGRLTPAEQAEATTMIENSDNDAATELWEAIGGQQGLDAANKRLGLRDTEGGPGLLWGLTQTTAGDQLRLLRQVFSEDSVLPSQAYLQGLMAHVETDQRWGVSAAGYGSCELKNGWLQRSQTGLWDVNSIGRVTRGSHSYLIAVLSKGSATEAQGITLVESAARRSMPAA